MPTALLTDVVAKAAKPIEGRQHTIWDSSLRGFGLRVGAEAKTWTVMVGKERRRITIGRYPIMGLQAARAEARRLMLASSVARNQPGFAPITFAAAFAKFTELHLPRVRESTAGEYERILRKHFLDVWKHKLLTEISRADLNRVLDATVRETPIQANNAFAVIRLFLRWSVRRGYLASSPCEAMQLPANRRTRDRVLAPEELRAVLSAAQATGVFGTIVTVLALTAQRRGEIAALRSEWIDHSNELIMFPKTITKNGREHALPVPTSVLDLLPKQSGFLFLARGRDEPFNGWSESMRAFRERCGVRDFTLHDLRRTAATGMAELGIPPHVIERVLNHVTGATAQSITPLARIYNRHTYITEMREALSRWNMHVTMLRS